MRLAVGLLFSIGIFGQDGPPIGLVRGVVLESEGTESAGELTLRGPENQVIRCHFNDKTYFERQKKRVPFDSLEPGDRVEMVADHGVPPTRCFARTVYVLEAPPAGVRRNARRPSLPSSRMTESIVPRGSLTFAGIVVRLSDGQLILRTREDGRKVIVLRKDTRYLSAGEPVELARLTLNTRVFIRAGRDLDNQIEAYQVIWGEILQPQ